MLYSDYCSVAKKYGLGDKIDFYADMARAFLMDRDAELDKLERYYRYIAKNDFPSLEMWADFSTTISTTF